MKYLRKDDFNENGFLKEEAIDPESGIWGGFVPVYEWDYNTREYKGFVELNIQPNTSIPENYVWEKPPFKEKKGFVIMRNEENTKWIQFQDHRGEEVYDIETKEKIIVDYVGKLKPNHTPSAPPSYNHEWNASSKKWFISKETQARLEKEEKESKIAQLESELRSLGGQALIAPNQEVVDGLKARSAEIHKELAQLKGETS